MTAGTGDRAVNLDWQLAAACRGIYDTFFGPDGETASGRDSREARAKRICSACTVRAECLEFGESLSEEVRRHGVYGGMGEEDRKTLHRSISQIRRQQRERAS